MARFLNGCAYDVLFRGEHRRQGYKYAVRASWTIELVHDDGHFACQYQVMRLRLVPELAPEDRTRAVWRDSAGDDFRDLLESVPDSR